AAHAHRRNDQPRQRPGRNARGGLARRRSASPARIAQPVLGVIGIVGMAGPELVGDLRIVLRALVDIADEHGNRRTGGDEFVPVLDDAGQDLDLVRLAALGDIARLTRPAPVEMMLDLLAPETDAGRAAVDDAAQRRTVAFAPG